MKYIKRKQIDEALAWEYRQYLTGHLSRKQCLPHIDDDLEIGISYYKEFTADLPHVHPVATEYAYVLSGSIRCLLLDGSGKEFQFNKGDFMLLPPGLGHATKNKAGTKVLFIKAPGINDKTLLEPDEEVRKWLESWD